MLSNFDLEELCQKLDLPLIGVFNKDQLPYEREVGSYYINMQDHDDGDGTHWTLAKIYCDDERDDSQKTNKPKGCGALYFDPFGIDMPIEVADFLSPFKPIAWNNRQIQNVNSTACGYYCLYCDYVLEHKQYDTTYLGDYERFLTMWDEDPLKNLALLKKFMKPL